MTPRLSVVGQIALWKPLRTFWRRAVLFLVPIIIALIFAAYPEKFRAEATLTPADPSTLGLSDTLGQLGALNSVFGKQADVEVALRIGTSIYTRQKVIEQLGLEKKLGKNNIATHRWLEDRLVMRSLRGGIILVQIDMTDAKLAQDIVRAFTLVIRNELAEITIRQTRYKRQILEKLVSDSGLRLSRAQSEYNEFRLKNGYGDPGRTVAIINDKVPSLRAEIEAADREIATASKMFTRDNVRMIEMVAARDALQQQLQQALSRGASTNTGTVGEAVSVSTKMFELDRELNLARSLYTNYLRYLEGTAVETLTSTANIRLLEQPYVSTERQYRWSLIALAIVLFLIWMAIEFYRLRPPVGANLHRRAEHPGAE